MNGTPWTPQQLADLDKLYADTLTAKLVAPLGHSLKAIYQQAKLRGLKKSEAFKASDASCRIQRGKQNANMRAQQFKPGHQSWNKGKKGLCFIGSKVSHFKKGHLPANTKADGVVTIRKYGKGYQYKHIRVALGKWVLYQRYVWQQHNGQIPAGSIIVFKDGNSLNCDISNLECITKKENASRNTIHRYPKEVKELIYLTNTVQRLINKRKNPLKDGKK